MLVTADAFLRPLLHMPKYIIIDVRFPSPPYMCDDDNDVLFIFPRHFAIEVGDNSVIFPAFFTLYSLFDDEVFT